MPKSTFFTALFMLVIQQLNAQQSVSKQFSFGLSFGTSVAYTDIKQHYTAPTFKYEKELSFSFNVYGEYTFTPILGMRGDFLIGQLAGTRRQDDHYFNAEFNDITLSGTINFSNLLFQRIKNKRCFLYGFIGAGMVNYRTIRRGLESEYLFEQHGYIETSDHKIKEKDKAITEVVIPVGLGLKYRLNNHLMIIGEASSRRLNKDNLDAYENGPTNDHYNYYGLGLNYTFGNSKKTTSNNVPPHNVSNIERIPSATSDKKSFFQAAPKETLNSENIDSLNKSMASLQYNITRLQEKIDHYESSNDIELTNSFIQENPEQLTKYTVLPSIYFEFNSTNLDYKHNLENLAMIADVLKANESIKLTVVGNTDTEGSVQYNTKLGLERVNHVIEHLAKVYQIDKSRFTPIAFGKKGVLLKNIDTINRRVDFIIEPQTAK